MNRRVRATGLVAASVTLCLTVTSASPIVGAAGVWRPGSPVTAGSGPSVSPRPVVEPAVGAVPSRTAVDELTAGPSTPEINFDEAGNVVALTAPPGQTIANPAGDGVDGFVRRYAGAFGLTSSYAAARASTTALPGGDSVVRFRQTAGGVPVLGGDIVVTTNAQGSVKGVVAEATQAIPGTTTATVGSARAGQTALTEAADRFGMAAGSLSVGSAELWLYDPALIGAPGQPGVRPVWWVEVLGPSDGRAATVLVDATDGSVALALNGRREAVDRMVCDLNGVEDVREFDLSDLNAYLCNPYSPLGNQTSTRREGGAASPVDAVNQAYEGLGFAHAYFKSALGVDSYNGHGAQLRATVRVCQEDDAVWDYYCPFPNAFWDGYQFAFGEGYAVDDVATHEFTHAVIDHASQLFYGYQPGAINESLADIFGELADQSVTEPGEDPDDLWLIGEDLPPHPSDGVSELRDMADPASLGQAAAFRDDFYYLGDADNGGVHINSGVGNRFAHWTATGIAGFPGIGLTKSAQLWYRVAHLMPSAGDWPTLGVVARQACVQLIGNYGFTRGDCFDTLQTARFYTSLTWPARFDPCPAGELGPAVFSDGFEGERRWTLTPGWSYLPGEDGSVRYAMEGIGSLYAYAPLSGPFAYATLNQPVAIPPVTAAGPPYLTYLVRNPSGGYASGGGFNGTAPTFEYAELSSPNQWIDGFGGAMFNNNITADSSASLAAIAGRTVWLRIKVRNNIDYAVDDVAIAGCVDYYDYTPIDPSAQWSGTGATVTWQQLVDTDIALTYDPPIPGAPTLLAANVPAQPVPITRSVSLTGLDPAKVYRVTVAHVDPAGQPVHPVVVEVRAEPSQYCLGGPAPFTQPLLTKTRPDDGCGSAPAPRRTNR
jgi:Zn-dependent metalloprotease